MSGVIDLLSPESLFLTQIGKTGVSNLLMLRYVKEASPREITAERRIIYSRSLHTVTPSTQPAADGAALRKRSRFINKKKNEKKSQLTGGEYVKKKGLTPRDDDRAKRWQTSLKPLGKFSLMGTKIFPSHREECCPPSTPCMEAHGTIYSF